MMIIKSKSVGPLETNCYVIGCEETKKAAVIDPGDEPKSVLAMVKDEGLEVQAIINTHAHVDHAGGVKVLKEMTGAPFYLHADDMFLFDNFILQGRAFGIATKGPPEVDNHLAEGDELTVGSVTIKVIHTPGHSPGSVCFVVKDELFVGDTIFAGSIGRSDLPGGDGARLIASIREKILPFDDGVLLHPGHGPSTTVGRERRYNPFVNQFG